MVESVVSEVRGIRNNNPTNIRYVERNNWKGRRFPKEDLAFEEFTEMAWGVRAAFVLIHKYIHVYKKITIAEILSRWAPPKENATQGYIKNVCYWGQLKPDDAFDPFDLDMAMELICNMIRMECGKYIDLQDVMKGYIYYLHDIGGSVVKAKGGIYLNMYNKLCEELAPLNEAKYIKS